jgi:hypothetical protein
MSLSYCHICVLVATPQCRFAEHSSLHFAPYKSSQFAPLARKQVDFINATPSQWREIVNNL